jgi:hypothetical protein
MKLPFIAFAAILTASTIAGPANASPFVQSATLTNPGLVAGEQAQNGPLEANCSRDGDQSGAYASWMCR